MVIAVETNGTLFSTPPLKVPVMVKPFWVIVKVAPVVTPVTGKEELIAAEPLKVPVRLKVASLFREPVMCTACRGASYRKVSVQASVGPMLSTASRYGPLSGRLTG